MCSAKATQPDIDVQWLEGNTGMLQMHMDSFQGIVVGDNRAAVGIVFYGVVGENVLKVLEKWVVQRQNDLNFTCDFSI